MLPSLQGLRLESSLPMQASGGATALEVLLEPCQDCAAGSSGGPHATCAGCHPAPSQPPLPLHPDTAVFPFLQPRACSQAPRLSCVPQGVQWYTYSPETHMVVLGFGSSGAKLQVRGKRANAPLGAHPEAALQGWLGSTECWETSFCSCLEVLLHAVVGPQNGPCLPLSPSPRCACLAAACAASMHRRSRLLSCAPCPRPWWPACRPSSSARQAH